MAHKYIFDVLVTDYYTNNRISFAWTYHELRFIRTVNIVYNNESQKLVCVSRLFYADA